MARTFFNFIGYENTHGIPLRKVDNTGERWNRGDGVIDTVPSPEKSRVLGRTR
jgi:hypothetical protein